MKKLKTIFPFFVSLALIFSIFNGCKQGLQEGEEERQAVGKALNQLTEAEKEGGWKLLFNGENFEGWRGDTKEAFPESGWVIDDNAMKCTGSGGGDVLYDQKFKDFRFKFEWKISRGGNSGVFYLGEETSRGVVSTAPEFQVLCNEYAHDAGRGDEGNHLAGSLYDILPADPQNTLPWGVWNRVEIIVQDSTVIHRQNGEQVVKYKLGTDKWEEMVNNSKFSDWEGFGEYRKGYISLQDHGDEVWFRNLKIKEL